MRENNNDFYMQERYGSQGMPVSVGAYTAKTFMWMCVGLLVTFAVAAGLAASGLIWLFFSIPGFQLILLVSELAVVLVLAARIAKLSVGAARALFLLYAVVNGVFFSTYFVLFDLASLVLIFGVTALYFGGLAAYGYFTKADLSRLRPILISGLIFLVVVGLLSLFLPLGNFERIYCLIGIAIFLGFTAYDTQKIRYYYSVYAEDPAMAAKASIYSALQLYLDFVNLFLYLLRFLGKRK